MPLEPELARLIPHSGTMCLLDRVRHWDDASISAEAASHLAADNPLVMGNILRGVHLCEYGAQAMALHGGLIARRDGRIAAPGLLVSLRDVTLGVDDVRTCAGSLLVTAERLHATPNAWQYRFAIVNDGRPLASGRAIVAVRTE